MKFPVPPAVRRSPVLSVAVLVLLISSVANASTVTPTTGTQEIGLTGSFGVDPSDTDNYSFLYGRFLNRNVEIAGSVSGLKLGGTTFRTFGIQPRFYLPNGSPFLPFVGYDHEEGRTTSTFGGSATHKQDYMQAGGDYFLTPNVALTGTFRYRFPLESFSGTIDFLLGLSTFIDSHQPFGHRSRADVVAIPSTGAQEIGVSGGSVINPGRSNNQQLYSRRTPRSNNLQLTYGYMISPYAELAAMVGSRDDDSAKSRQWRVKPEFCLRTGTPALPYLAVFYGENRATFHFSPSETIKDRGVEVGVKYFLNSNVAVTAAYQYNDLTYDVPGNIPTPFRPDSHTSAIVTGVSVFIDGRRHK